MTTEHIPLRPLAPGAMFFLTVQRFGVRGARPRVYIQASLHADEVPGMITAHHLRENLIRLEAEGKIQGEIILVPSANPIGLAQRVLGKAVGRFNLADGVNFNRSYPYLVPKVAEQIESQLTNDGAANVNVIREALRHQLAAAEAKNPADVLKKTLLGMAMESDFVLDLHCDAEAVVHLYTHPRSRDSFVPLGAWLGAKAVLLAEESGDDPFDEACSRPWAELATRFPNHPIPFGCHSTTLEFRGEGDVTDEFARTDAAALLAFLTFRGAIGGGSAEASALIVPQPLCQPTPLAGSEQIAAPASGMVIFKASVGQQMKTGEVVAEIVDPLTGERTSAPSTTDGVLFARIKVRFATEGQPLAKVAGTNPRRTGKLLTA